MGCGGSKDDSEQRRRNAEIDQSLRAEENRLKNEVKMLILGAGESGKSTILKQMKLIHDNGYSVAEREAFKDIIFSNTVQSMKVLVNAMESLEIPFEKEENLKYAKVIQAQPQQFEIEVFPEAVAESVKALWQDNGIQTCFSRSREYQLNDSAKYYFESIDRIAAPDYIPNDQDLLRSRVKTTGISETSFKVGDMTYRMFDVGGQRSERKKWIHCFENVTALVFMVAISEYDQKLVEDESVNRMMESLNLFDSIVNSKWFIKTPIILFLNKIDLFMAKLPASPVEQYFPEYTGGTYEEACEFFLDKFRSLKNNPDKEIYPHFTCATDTSQIKFVMAAVYDIIVKTSLRNVGLF